MHTKDRRRIARRLNHLGACQTAMTTAHDKPRLPTPRIPTTDFARLQKEVCRGAYRQALPQALPDEWLMALTRDLFLVERDLRLGQDSFGGHNAVSGPLLLGLHLLLGRLRERGRAHHDASLQLAPERVSAWLQTLQVYSEKELVRRVIGMPVDPQDSASFLAAIDEELSYLPMPRCPDDQRPDRRHHLGAGGPNALAAVNFLLSRRGRSAAR
jgi:hypothetical protein